MAMPARAADYNSAVRPTDSGGVAAAPSAGAIRTTPREAGPVPEFLHLLARAVQQFHTYPETSPMCQAAVEACQRAVVSLDQGDRVTFRVTPRELVVNETAVGRGTLIESELARRLHLASIAQVTIERAASVRELSRFCKALVRYEARQQSEGLIELLAEHGVDRISFRRAYRPEVLQVGVTPPPVAALVQRQRARAAEVPHDKTVVNHLYPPDRGWVRVDPSSELTDVSLIDLAVLADNPEALATMLMRLTDDKASAAGGDALLEKYSEVTAIFEALEPRVARVMFSKLARAVLDLDSERRQALLRRTILPGLLDGRVDGAILRDFPDVDLAESLCLLLDLETAAPEVAITALSRLDLSAERQAAVTPLLEERLSSRLSGPRESSIDAHARKLVTIDHGQARSFAEFAAFDLALDARAVETLAEIRTAVSTSDPIVDQIHCLWNLSRLEPNPDVVQRFVARATPLLEDLEHGHRWRELADWLSQYRELADALRELRPDVAAVIVSMLAGLCTPRRARAIVELAAGADGREPAGRLLAALGSDVVPAVLGIMQSRSGEARDQIWRAGVQLLCDHAKQVAPALVAALENAQPAMACAIARVLGLAGRGYEAALARQLHSTDEQTVREAFRSLAHIGTPQAAAAVCTAIDKRQGWISDAAEEALWRFPRAEAERQARALLARREFVLRRPRVAARLLDRTAQPGAAGMAAILSTLAPLRYRIWSPAVARLGRQARELASR